jgi:hypothetical protein
MAFAMLLSAEGEMKMPLPMTSERLTLANASCVIDVVPAPAQSEPGQRFVARMSLVDPGGAVVHPLVGADGRSIKILADSEDQAIQSAASFLEGRFGRLQSSGDSVSLGTATVGAPLVVG